jgi:DNA-binding beta-propeller fold protein YncE
MASRFGSVALAAAIAAFVLAGCSGSQPIGAPRAGVEPRQLQEDATSTPLPGGAVWHPAPRPLPRYPQSSEPLLYVGNDSQSAVDIFPLTGPNQQQIGTVSNGVDSPWGLSIDANKSLYVANAGNHTVTVYPYGSATPSMTYSILGAALYALADSAGHVFVSGWNQHHQGHVIEFNAGRNRVIAHVKLGSETDGMAEDGQGNLYVAYRGKVTGSIAEFGPGLTKKRHLGVRIWAPQGLLVDHAGNIIVVESTQDRIDVFPPGATTPSVTVSIFGSHDLAELAMQNNETTLWVCSEGGYVYSMPYPLTASTVPTEYEEINGGSNGVAVSPQYPQEQQLNPRLL